MNKLSGWDDTIVATATAPGLAAIAVIRLSGPEAIGIVNALFPSKNLHAQASHTLHVGYLKDDETLLDEVVIAIYKNPKSFTGEDVVEISTHGSPHIQEQVVRACIRKGARAARPGEFTQRAFLNGKMDLTQAEAVADLIASNSDASRQAALHNIRGGFAADLKYMREQLIQFAALIELELDFATEDVEFADRTQLKNLLQQVQARTAELLASFTLGNVIKQGVSVAIIGKPNAGKSTLLNALLNEERAIVSEVAGTTRDSIEETLNISGILFRLIDTAGIRSHSTDLVENIGIQRSLDKMRSADVVIYLFDASAEDEASIQLQADAFASEGIRYLLAGNKADTAGINFREKFRHLPVHFLSAKNKTGVQALRQTLFDFSIASLPASEGTIITNSRHYEALLQVQQSLTEVQAGLHTALPGDLLSLELRRSLYFLGEITGEISNEDKLDFIFSKFCIGK